MNKSIMIKGLLIITLLSGCGTLTKMRYSHGYKVNIEWSGKKDAPVDETFLPLKAVKKRRVITSENTTAVKEKRDTVLSTPKNCDVNYSEKSLNRRKAPLKPAVKFFVVPDLTNDKKPMEPHIAAGGMMFYGGYAVSFLFSFLMDILLLPVFVFLLPAAFILAGFIFSITGLHRFNLAPNDFRGEGLAISVIVLFIISLLTTLAYIAILALIFM